MPVNRPSAYAFPSGMIQIFFRGSDSHIIRTGSLGDRVDLSEAVNVAPPLAIGAPSVTMLSSQVHVFYRDENKHISDLWGGAPTPSFWQDLHQVVSRQSGQEPPLAMSDPFSVGYPTDGAAQIQIFYIGDNYHICRFSYELGGQWVFTDVTAGIAPTYNGLINPRSDSSLCAAVLSSQGDNQLHVFYRNEQDAIQDLWGGQTPTFVNYLSNGVKNLGSNSKEGAWGNPFSLFFTPPAYNALIFSQIHVFYRGWHGSICDLSNAYGEDWYYTNLNETVTGAKPPLAHTDGVPYAVTFGSQIHVFYRDTDNRISHLWNTPSFGYPARNPTPPPTSYEDLIVAPHGGSYR